MMEEVWLCLIFYYKGVVFLKEVFVFIKKVDMVFGSMIFLGVSYNFFCFCIYMKIDF